MFELFGKKQTNKTTKQQQQQQQNTKLTTTTTTNKKRNKQTETLFIFLKIIKTAPNFPTRPTIYQNKIPKISPSAKVEFECPKRYQTKQNGTKGANTGSQRSSKNDATSLQKAMQTSLPKNLRKMMPTLNYNDAQMIPTLIEIKLFREIVTFEKYVFSKNRTR